MSWRPKEGWENPYKDITAIRPSQEIAFEAGADAMLEALRNSAKRFEEWEPVGKNGYLIFIPDEAAKEQH